MSDSESTFEDQDIAGKGAEADADDPASSLDRENLFRRLKRWFMTDKRHSEDWRRQAENEFDFVSGRQWSAEDMAKLREQMRPVVTFNRLAPTINAVSGMEVSNRQELRYVPRQQGDAQADEMLTATAKWFDDECNGEDEVSDAFFDTIVCGMGWTESRMDFETDQDGAPLKERVDPLEMYWDAAAKRRCLEDARRIWRVKKVPKDEAISLVEGLDVDDEELDASWAAFDDRGNKDETRQEARFYRPTKEGSKDDDDELITLVECQWWERETVYAVAGDSGVTFLTEDEWETAVERAEQAGIELPKSAKQTRRKYFRVWLGDKVLAEPEEAPFGDHFSYQSITGYRDRNKGTFYGLARGMMDPQQWANKFLAQTMHIVNTVAIPGVMVEDGAFADEREAENSWAKPNKFVRMTKGALSNPNGARVMPKPQAVLPPQLEQLLQFSLQSIRDASGVNLELLGMQDKEQAGVLEMQRKKQAMMVLATLFDSLRRYRKNEGRLRLWLIQNYVSDNRLVRVNGDGSTQYIPFIRRPDWGQYDVIVDDAPSSPQQKEIAWAVFMQLMQTMKTPPSPEMLAMMLEYSPLPPSAAEKFKAVTQQDAMSRQQMGAEQHALQVAGAQAKIKETQSKADLNLMKAGKEAVATQKDIHTPIHPPPHPPQAQGLQTPVAPEGLPEQAQGLPPQF